LHLPKEPSLAGRKLVVTARLVLAHSLVFRSPASRSTLDISLFQPGFRHIDW
jgi:hypothetical protein